MSFELEVATSLYVDRLNIGECEMKRTRTFVPTERTTLKRLPKRATYERDTIYQILDEGFVCHVGFIVDGVRLC